MVSIKNSYGILRLRKTHAGSLFRTLGDGPGVLWKLLAGDAGKLCCASDWMKGECGSPLSMELL